MKFAIKTPTKALSRTIEPTRRKDIKKITFNGDAFLIGATYIFVVSTAYHMTSIQPSVVIKLNIVMTAFPMLSKFALYLVHSPPAS